LNVINKEALVSGFLEAVFLAYLATVLAQSETPDKTPDIVVNADGKCTTQYEYIQCDDHKPCKEDKKIEWDVTNHYAQDAIVVVFNLKHRASGLYVDPLVGPGNDGLHAVKVNYGGKESLKTKVRKIELDYFLGQYEYKVAVSFDNGGSFGVCLDPRIDIGK